MTRLSLVMILFRCLKAGPDLRGGIYGRGGKWSWRSRDFWSRLAALSAPDMNCLCNNLVARSQS